MLRGPPRSTQSRSSAASDVYKRQGYSGAAIRDGRIFVADYDQQKQGDAIRCFSLADGKEIWRYFYPVKVKRNHGMSRTVPAVTDKNVVTMGPKCHVACLDVATGKLHWFLDLVKDYGAKVPAWYAGQCPLIEDGKVILGVGGASLILAVDIETGNAVWESPNPKKWEMTHSSIAGRIRRHADVRLCLLYTSPSPRDS